MATSRPPMICSICDASLDMDTSGKRLYGYNVCGTCHSSFAMKRAFAYILDTVLFCIVAVPLTFFILLLSGISGAAVGAATHNDNSAGNMAVLVFFACLFGLLFLFIAKDGFAGHSPAKAILGLQVIDDLSGRPCNFWDSFQRNLPPQIPLVQWYILYQLLQYDGRRLGDGWSRTKVIWKPYRDKAPFLSRRQLQAQLAAKAAGKT
ncbi:MAG TPA: RDD family protein [Terriglobales bacterium]|nr:RDD family protein [Terriglobales bacterium]